MLALLHSTIAFLPLKMIVKFAVVVDGCDARARPSIPDVWSHVIHDGRVHFGVPLAHPEVGDGDF